MDPFPSWLEKLWNAWDLRVMVVWSLTLQIILIIFGNRRKYTRGFWIDVMVWLSYLMADWVATVALGKLSHVALSDQTENPQNIMLIVLWAPLLLLHLGGPDTITAYSVEDTELWGRHLLGLSIQVSVAIYVFLWCWNGSWLSILIIPMFISGIIKYSERTWALWFVNNKQEDSSHEFFDSIENRLQVLDFIGEISLPSLKLPVMGYFFSKFLTPYLEDYIYAKNSSFAVDHMSFLFENYKSAFKISEFSFGFVYDFVYTKASIVYTILGCILRLISFTCTVTVLVVFPMISKHHFFSRMEFLITYLLLSIAVVLETYSLARLIFSDWTVILLLRYRKKPILTPILRILAPWTLRNTRRRWSNSVAQFDLLSFCLYRERQTMVHRILKFSGIGEEFEKYWCESCVLDAQQMDYLKQLIFEVMKKSIHQLNQRGMGLFGVCGQLTLERYDCGEDFSWIDMAEFDEHILSWHIATTMCYHDQRSRGIQSSRLMETSMILSNYSAYIIVKFPYMFPITSGKIMFRNTCELEIPLIIRSVASRDRAEICSELRQAYHVETEQNTGKVSENAAKLAGTLLSQKCLDNLWDIISEVWAEIICAQAAFCNVKYHVQQLRRGGELLSHIRLLLSVTGFSNKVRVRGEELRTLCEGAFEPMQQRGDVGLQQAVNE